MPTTQDNEQTTTETQDNEQTTTKTQDNEQTTTETKPQSSNPPAKEKAPLPERENPPYPGPEEDGTASSDQ